MPLFPPTSNLSASFNRSRSSYALSFALPEGANFSGASTRAGCFEKKKIADASSDRGGLWRMAADFHEIDAERDNQR
jgi:hypothetical protein